MSLDVESVLQRRRMRRQIGWWRSLAILAGVAVFFTFFYVRSDDIGIAASDQIARVTIDGLITDDRERLNMLKKIGEADHVKAVILFVNSPGGTTTGGEGLYHELRDLSEKKPVVAQFGTIAASAAYIAGLGTDHIVARGNTITGSVGVVVQWPEISGLLDKIGVRINELKSGPLKAEPSPYGPASPEALAVTKSMIEDSQQWFVGLVRERRNIDPAAIPGLLEGRVYSGRDAIRYDLIDAVGAEDEAIDWLVKERGVKEGLNVVDWKPSETLPWSLQNAVSSVVQGVLAGIGDGLQLAGFGGQALSTIGLDGLISVWHPSKM